MMPCTSIGFTLEIFPMKRQYPNFTASLSDFTNGHSQNCDQNITSIIRPIMTPWLPSFRDFSATYFWVTRNKDSSEQHHLQLVIKRDGDISTSHWGQGDFPYHVTAMYIVSDAFESHCFINFGHIQVTVPLEYCRIISFILHIFSVKRLCWFYWLYIS